MTEQWLTHHRALRHAELGAGGEDSVQGGPVSANTAADEHLGETAVRGVIRQGFKSSRNDISEREYHKPVKAFLISNHGPARIVQYPVQTFGRLVCIEPNMANLPVNNAHKGMSKYVSSFKYRSALGLFSVPERYINSHRQV